MEDKTKSRLVFDVFPLWKFMQDTYGIEKAFENFEPYRGANVKVKIHTQHSVDVFMEQTIGNTNYVGAHFGGSLYSMCDPFYMFLLIWNLGDNYIVWDKSARIEFVSPGKGTVRVNFSISQEEIDEVISILMKQKKTNRYYSTEIFDENGKVVAKLEKEIYIRKKR